MGAGMRLASSWAYGLRLALRETLGFGPSGNKELHSGLEKGMGRTGKTMGRDSSRPSGRKEEGGGIPFFFPISFQSNFEHKNSNQIQT